MKPTLAIVAALAMGLLAGRPAAASSTSSGTIVQGVDSNGIRVDFPFDLSTQRPAFDCYSGATNTGCGSGGSGGSGIVTQGPQAATASGNTWFVQDTNSAAILAAENSALASPGSSSASATGVQGVTGGKPVAVSDPANAAFSTSTAITVAGATVAAGRTLQVDCSAGGAITMTLSGGGSAVLNVVASAQSQFFPFAVTAITASTATGTYHNLN